MQNKKQSLGAWGESVAVDFLKRHDYIIVAQNFATDRGEVDIIGRSDDTLCFVEVKTRTNWAGSAERAVGGYKIKHMMMAARYFCRQYHIDMSRESIRFEQISIYCNPGDKSAQITKYILPSAVHNR